jgi:hypothetical protein
MILVVQLDLDKHDLETIEHLATADVITLVEALEAKCLRKMSVLDRLRWHRKMRQRISIRNAS